MILINFNFFSKVCLEYQFLFKRFKYHFSFFFMSKLSSITLFLKKKFKYHFSFFFVCPNCLASPFFFFNFQNPPSTIVHSNGTIKSSMPFSDPSWRRAVGSRVLLGFDKILNQQIAL